MEANAKSTHPLILVAATSVTIASLAAAAYFTGLLPSRSAEPAPAPVAALSTPAPAEAVPPPAAKAETAPAPEASRPSSKHSALHRPAQATAPVHRADTEVIQESRHYEGGNRRVADNNAGIDVIPSPPAAPVPAAAPPLCRECGTVENVREIAVQGEGSALGAVAGGLLGGVLGHQVGRGSGKDLATIAGAVGGAFAGHQVEKNVRTGKQFQVAVRFDDGTVRSFTQANPAWRSGDRVRLANGTLVAINQSDR